MAAVRILVLTLVVPVPAAMVLWVDALPTLTSYLFHHYLFVVLVGSAAVLSVTAAIRRIGPQHAFEGSRTGLLIIAVAIFSYLYGTMAQSDALHLLSIMAFYLGCVLFLGGPRYLISVAPGLLIMLSVLPFEAYGGWVQNALEIALAGLVVASLILLWTSRGRAESDVCRLCSTFMDKGESFCKACGKNLKPSAINPRYMKFATFAIFSLLLISLLAVSVPVVTVSPSTSLVTFTLGGMRDGGPLAPLPGWGVSSKVQDLSGQKVYSLDLHKGKASIEALLSVSPYYGVAVGSVDQLTGNMTVSSNAIAPPVENLAMYSTNLNGTRSEGVQGVFLVGVLNGSKLSQSYVAFNLQQTIRQFESDNGSTLYAAGAAVAGWLSYSANWSPSIGPLLSGYQFMSQTMADASLGLFAIFLFSTIRNHDLSIERKLESTFGLTDRQLAHLRAFSAEEGLKKGEELLAIARKVDAKVDEPVFYRELDELSRRGLLAPQVSMIKHEPILLWRCLI